MGGGYPPPIKIREEKMSMPEYLKRLHDKIVSAIMEIYISQENCTKEREHAILSSDDIYEKICLDIDFKKETFRNYISSIAGSPDSIIKSAFKDFKKSRRKGYYIPCESYEELLKLKKEEKDEEEKYTSEENELEEKKIRGNQEEILYPILYRWLEVRGYDAFYTYPKKKNKKWGNPDITGIKVDEFLGSRSVEIATIEAKVSCKNFREDFFEAVSHRRFSNICYYAFASDKNFFEIKESEEILYYSDLYNVGIILIHTTEEYYKKISDGEIEKIDEEMVDIKLINSPSAEQKGLRHQKSFLENMGIQGKVSLYETNE